MGIKTRKRAPLLINDYSEKPPHHMGIKTKANVSSSTFDVTLKNLPTTWGLRRTSDSTLPSRQEL